MLIVCLWRCKCVPTVKVVVVATVASSYHGNKGSFSTQSKDSFAGSILCGSGVAVSNGLRLRVSITFTDCITVAASANTRSLSGDIAR
jgi:hypothetical protein